jgi:signal transduction histidine kinase
VGWSNDDGIASQGTPLDPLAPAVGEAPVETTVERRIREQRLRLVRIFAIGLAIFGAIGAVGFRALGGPSPPAGYVGIMLGTTVLSLSGVGAALLCRSGRLRPASYLMVLPLLLQGVLDLTLTSNLQGPALIVFFVAISIAALAFEGRDWPLLAVLVTVSATCGAFLQSFPLSIQVEVPHEIAAASNLLAIPIGLAYPLALFWLFRRDLTASLAEAWSFARLAARANSLKSEFLDTMSHDLRSPLHVIIGSTQILREETVETLDPSHAVMLDRIERYSLDLLKLVEGCLQVSRLESGQVPLRVEAFSVEEVVGEVVEALSLAPRGGTVEVRARVAPDLPAMNSDRLKVKEVIQNLASNAVKFTPSGFVEIRARVIDHDVEVEVEDTGVGIAPEDLPLIFDSFVQSKPTDAGLGGVGLGLYIVKRLVGFLGGSASAESTVGRGSTFRVRLPAELRTSLVSVRAGATPPDAWTASSSTGVQA